MKIYSISVPLILMGLVAGIILVNGKITDIRQNQIPQVAGEIAMQDGVYTQTVSDGDKTAEITKEIRDGKIYITVKTYDQDGNLLKTTNQVRDYTVPVKDTTTQPTSVKQEISPQPEIKQQVQTKQQIQDTQQEPVKTELQQIQQQEQKQLMQKNMFEIRGEQVTVSSAMPIVVDEKTGDIFVQNADTNIPVQTTPDDAANLAVQTGAINNIKAVSLEAQGVSAANYVINGTKDLNLLGIVNLQFPATVTLDSQDGSIVNIKRSILSKLVGSLN